MRAASDVVDVGFAEARFRQLACDQGRQIAVWLWACAIDDDATLRRVLELACDVFADLECADAYVGTDRGNDLLCGDRHGANCCRKHAGDGSAPTRMRGRDGARRRVPKQHRNTVCGAYGERTP